MLAETQMLVSSRDLLRHRLLAKSATDCGSVSCTGVVRTACPAGQAVIARILEAAAQTFRDPRFRAVLQIEGQPGFAAVMDEDVAGHVLQLVEIFTLNAQGEVAGIRIFTRPWAVTADLRQGIHEHSGDLLGPEFWGDPQHSARAAEA
jgi:hypothetical protein